jgi:hypothetical protein
MTLSTWECDDHFASDFSHTRERERVRVSACQVVLEGEAYLVLLDSEVLK